MSGQEQKPRPSGRGVVTEPTNGGLVPATTTAAPQTIQEVPRAMPAIARPPIPAGASPRGIVPTSFDEVKRMAAMAVEAGLAGKIEKEEEKSQAVARAGMIILKGLELNLTPTMALDGIALVNGRTCVWGKLVPALVRRAGHKIEEWETGTRLADDWTFHCRITRGDTDEIIERSFSVADAKHAKLWSPDPKVKRFKKGGESYIIDNDSPWHKYPQRMLPARARGYAAADGASEALLGMYTVEEMQDVERAEREIQEEERGHLVMAPPPPLAEIEPAPSPDDAASAPMAIDESAPIPTPSDQPNPASEEVADAPSEDAIQLAAVSCASAMTKANTIERLDQLMGKFHEKFDGYIPKKISNELETIHENSVRRITGAGAG